jgi:hypothetical protein
MDCQKCILNLGPHCIDIDPDCDSKDYYGWENCPNRRLVRTEVGNFYACPMCMYQFGPGTIYGIPGWYPGRGY